MEILSADTLKSLLDSSVAVLLLVAGIIALLVLALYLRGRAPAERAEAESESALIKALSNVVQSVERISNNHQLERDANEKRASAERERRDTILGRIAANLADNTEVLSALKHDTTEGRSQIVSAVVIEVQANGKKLDTVLEQLEGLRARCDSEEMRRTLNTVLEEVRALKRDSTEVLPKPDDAP